MQRLRDAIMVVCRTAAELEFKLLSIPLSKAIFLSDRETYFATAKPLIADAYIHGQFGPYLEELREACEDLALSRHIVISHPIYPGHVKPFTEFALGSCANSYAVSSLTEKEVSLIKRVAIEVLTDEPPLAAAMATHNHAWQITGEKEHIPLAAQVLTGSAKVTEKDRNWAKRFMGICQ